MSMHADQSDESAQSGESALSGESASAFATSAARARRWPRRLWFVAVMLGGFVVWMRFGPTPQHIRYPAPATELALAARDGTPLDSASARLVRNGAGKSTSSATVPVAGPSLARRADRLAAATLAAEDERFRSHPGVDAISISRAMIENVRARRLTQGASTITQQLVKLRDGARRGLVPKLQYAVWAVRLERTMSKDQILSAYLAEAPYGGRVVGAEAAARAYFDTTPAQLSWAQAAFLAAIPQRPSAFNPRRSPVAAVKRQRWILGRLRARGDISSTTYERALAEELTFADPVDHFLAPHFSEMLEQRCGRASQRSKPSKRSKPPVACASSADGRVLRTTIDAALQRDIVGIARRHRDEMLEIEAGNVAVVVLDNETGAVRAWEGSGDFFDPDHGGMINGPLIPRQTGSTIKPFLYAAGFERGLLPGDMLQDEPFEVSRGGHVFRPQNYDRRFRGPVTARDALGNSVNVAAVRVLHRYGMSETAALLQRAGIRIPRPLASYGLSMALGTIEVPLVDLVAAYAAFPRDGRALTPVFFEDEASAARELPSDSRVVSMETAFMVNDVLADNEARADAFGRTSAMNFSFPVAAKTGTSQDFHDNWVVGYTPEFTVGVWVGNFDRTPLAGATGVSGAGPVFHAVVQAAQRRLVGDNGTGGDYRVDPSSMSWLGTPMPSPFSRDQTCTGDVCNPNGRELTLRGRSRTETTVPNAEADARSSDRAQAGSSGPLRIVSPSDGAQFLIDSERPLELQGLAIRTAGGVGPRRTEVDGVPVEGIWPLQRGEHRACVLDATDTRVCARFSVRD